MNGKSVGQLITTLPFLLLTCNNIWEKCQLAILHKKRFKRLANRVKLIQIYFAPLFDDTQTMLRNPKSVNFVLLMKTCLEDIETFVKRFMKSDRKLSIRVFKCGSDEEEFIKLGERLQFSSHALNLDIDAAAIFNHAEDADDFKEDLADLNKNLTEIVGALTKVRDPKKIERLVNLTKTLISQQESKREEYYSKRTITSDIILDGSDITCFEIIGSGGFGQVYRGNYKGNEVAIKKLKGSAFSKEALKNFQNEANVMRRLSHPRTLACIGVVTESKEGHSMVMEFMQNKSLGDNIINNSANPLEWPIRAEIALDISIGMAYLHRLQIIHRSLKSTNVLLDRNNRAKVADFGMSVARTETATIMKVDEFSGTAQYTAPEAFGLSPKYSTKSDVFSYGMVLWELCHWKLSFHDDENLSAYEIKDFHAKGERLEVHDSLPKSFESLIKCSWHKDVNQRPPFPEVQAFLEVIDLSEDVSNEQTPFKTKGAKQQSAEQTTPLITPRMSMIAGMPNNDASQMFSAGKLALSMNSTQATSEPINNKALQEFWTDFQSCYQPSERSWDSLYEFIRELYLKPSQQLDKVALRKKLDFKTGFITPTLRRMYQIIQDAEPREFFCRFAVISDSPTTAPSLGSPVPALPIMAPAPSGGGKGKDVKSAHSESDEGGCCTCIIL